MKVNELMIGDWVAFRGRPYQYTAQDIATMAECEEKGIATDTTPIPITPEILEKNGFENDFYEDESVADYVMVRLEGYSLRCKANGWDDALVTWCNGHLEVVTDFNGEVRKDIDHVNELQHALRLCGIEKEIAL